MEEEEEEAHRLCRRHTSSLSLVYPEIKEFLLGHFSDAPVSLSLSLDLASLSCGLLLLNTAQCDTVFHIPLFH